MTFKNFNKLPTSNTKNLHFENYSNSLENISLLSCIRKNLQQQDEKTFVYDSIKNLQEKMQQKQLLDWINYIQEDITMDTFYECNQSLTLYADSKDKLKYSIKIKVLPIRNELKYLLLINDITESQRQLETQANLEYQQKLLQSFQHQIRTPMNSIVSPLDLCLSDINCPQSIKDTYLKRIKAGTLALNSFISDIITYFQILQNNFVLKIESISFSQLFKDLQEQFAEVFETKEINFILDYEERFQTNHFYSDYQRIRQILTNFLTNSIKFTQKRNTTIKLIVIENLNSIKIMVEDQGLGMN